MENEYGIPVGNKYSAFVDDEGDPFELISKQEQKQKEEAENAKKQAARAKSAPKGKKQAKIAPPPKEEKPVQDNRSTSKGQVRNDGDRPRSNRGRGDYQGNRFQENRAPRHQRRDDQGFGSGSQEQSDRPPRREFRGPPRRFDNQNEGGDQENRDRGFRGRGRGRGGYRGGGFKRDFDRRSGNDKTGVKAVDKRDGAGPHNWGTANDELKEFESGEQTPASPEKKEWAQDGEEPEVNAEKDPDDKENNPETEVDAGPKEFTLDEWKAMQSSSRPQQEFNVRKPNEGADQTQWKKYTMLKKKPATEEQVEYEEQEDVQDRKDTNITAQMNFTFNDIPQRGGRGRRGGAGFRGGFGGRGRGRGEGYDRPRQERTPRGREVHAPKLGNEEEFPSLGAK